VAEQHAVDADRTVCMGRVMGAAALGVLIGYPIGGFLYAFLGKLVPFLLIATLAFMNCGKSPPHLSNPKLKLIYNF